MTVRIVLLAALYTACGGGGKNTGPTTTGSGEPVASGGQTSDRGGGSEGGGGDGRSLSTVRFRSLAVTVTPPGGGTVSDNFESYGSAVRDCMSCRETYRLGTRVVLTASAAPGFVFARWHGSNCDGSPSLTCSLVIDDHKQLTAVFAPAP